MITRFFKSKSDKFFAILTYLNIEQVLGDTSNWFILIDLKNLWNFDNKCTYNDQISDKFADSELQALLVQEVILEEESVEAVLSEDEPFQGCSWLAQSSWFCYCGLCRWQEFRNELNKHVEFENPNSIGKLVIIEIVCGCLHIWFK